MLPNMMPRYKTRFVKLFLKWWLIIFLARAILISLAGFGANVYPFMVLGPVTMWIGMFAMLTTPELDLADKLFGGLARPDLIVIPFTFFLIAVTSSVWWL
jgi:hypothetical protein